MATPTYSQSVLAVQAGPEGLLGGAKVTTIPDTSANGYASGQPNGLYYVMQQREQVLCKGPDGGLHWYHVGGTPQNPILYFVGP